MLTLFVFLFSIFLLIADIAEKCVDVCCWWYANVNWLLVFWFLRNSLLVFDLVLNCPLSLFLPHFGFTLFRGGGLPRGCGRKRKRWRRQWRRRCPHIRFDVPLVRRLQVQGRVMRVGVAVPVGMGVAVQVPMTVRVAHAQRRLARPQSCGRSAEKGVWIAKIILWRRHHFGSGWKHTKWVVRENN